MDSIACSISIALLGFMKKRGMRDVSYVILDIQVPFNCLAFWKAVSLVCCARKQYEVLEVCLCLVFYFQAFKIDKCRKTIRRRRV